MNSIFIVFGVVFVAQLATAQNATYQAGALELNTRRVNASVNLNSETLLNANRFVQWIRSNEARTLDILVFPEAVLNFPQTAVRVPLPRDAIVACGNQNQDPILQMLSCAVRDARTYVTVQLYMRTNCTEDRLQYNDTRPCTIPRNNTNIYNAAVVFNRIGAVIAVYRKFNLHNEPNVRRPLVADITTFPTDFNVTFGVFTCFDILFDAPANQLVRNGIRNFVSPSFWYSELPYLTAIQTQQMWSHRHNVNLIVAGANLPREGVTGTGIYSGTLGHLGFEFSNQPTNRLVAANVTGIPRTFDLDLETRENQDVYGNDAIPRTLPVLPGLEIRREQLNNFNTRFLNITSNATSHFRDRICINNDNRVCCEYDISVTLLNVTSGWEFYSYAIAVFNGHRRYTAMPSLNTRQMVCSLVTCTRFGAQQTCGLRAGSTGFPIAERVRFDRLILRAQIITGNDGRSGTVVMANTLNRNILPMHPSEFQFNLAPNDNANQNQTAELTLRWPRENIQTFAIYARNPLQDFRASSNMVAVNSLLLMVLTAFITLFNQ